MCVKKGCIKLQTVLLNFLFICESWKIKCITVSTKILCSTTVFNIDHNRNVSWAVNHHIRMISEGSCDTEDWSNDAENSAAHHSNKWQFNRYSHRKQLFLIVKIFHNCCCIFTSNKPSSGECCDWKALFCQSMCGMEAVHDWHELVCVSACGHTRLTSKHDQSIQSSGETVTDSRLDPVSLCSHQPSETSADQ